MKEKTRKEILWTGDQLWRDLGKNQHMFKK